MKIVHLWTILQVVNHWTICQRLAVIEASEPPVEPPEQRIGFLIYRAGLAVAQAYEQAMRPSGFVPGEIGVLTHLASQGPTHVREVGRSLGVSPQTVVNLARGLEAKGLLDKSAAPADRRTVVLRITASGREVLAKADEVACGIDDAIETLVGEDAPAVSRALRVYLREHGIGRVDKASIADA